MEKILVSSCLLGFRVRYDGSDRAVAHRLWQTWMGEGRLVPLCPEVSAGLPVPRPPAEIRGGCGKAVLAGSAVVVEEGGRDVTEAFVLAANNALALVRQHGLRVAVLTDGSPSCGGRFIYDGTFSGRRKAGEGVVAARLRQHGVKVFSESEITKAATCLRQLESSSST